MAQRRVYLVDGPLYVFRAYFSLPDSLTDPQGWPANAVYGFGQFLCGLLAQERPSHILVAFDESLTTSFRNDWYADYKINRERPPEALKRQFQGCQRVCRALGVNAVASRRFEADDLIATAVARLRPRGFKFTIVSRDKDLAQLIGPGDRWWDGADGERLTAQGVKARFGVPPRCIADYLALVGDSVDNIPGVPGIGPKAAVALLEHFGSLDNIYRRLDGVPGLSLRGARRIHQLLAEHEAQARLSLQLATLHTGARIKTDPSHLQWRGIKPRSVKRLFNDYGFGRRLLERCQALEPRTQASR